MSSSLLPRCGAAFELPTLHCRLPVHHLGEHAPDPIATAMIALQVMNDELEADRREFESERARMLAHWDGWIVRLRTTTIAVGVVGCVSVTLCATACYQLMMITTG